MKRSGLAFLLLLVGGFAEAVESPKYLKLNPIKSVVVHEGQTVTWELSGTVAEGLHIQANPASAPNLIPTEIKLNPRKGVEVGKAIYPEGKKYRLKGSDKDILAFEGPFIIKVPITAALAKPGKYELAGTFHYQACNDQTCFFPQKIDLKLPVQVKK